MSPRSVVSASAVGAAVVSSAVAGAGVGVRDPQRVVGGVGAAFLDGDVGDPRPLRGRTCRPRYA